ncbi:MAG: pyridoxal phosphate-dependent aminotransferase [Vicinamibacterales bacterium]|nr:pyridoxal phosphate-dependent aminotransferase [Vicinamibacterales bacterium]
MRDLIPSRIRGIELPPFDPLNRRAAELRAAGHHVISLGQAVPFFPPPASALDAARAAIDRPDVNRYATDQGLPRLRDILADRLAETLGSTLTGEDLVITAGGNHAFTLALTTLVDPGDEVILPAPYFTNHQMAVVSLGATPVEAPIADRTSFDVRWTDIEPRLTDRTKAIVLCNPSNPTGAPVSAVEGARIVREAVTRGILVISDDTYMQFVYEGAHWSAASVRDWRHNVVVIGTFSKSFGMMGWRVGFVLADAAICEQAVKVQDAMIICAPVISQMAAEAAVRDSWEYPTSFHDELRQRRRVLADGLATIPGIEWTPTRGGMCAFARIAGCDDSTRLSNDLLERAHVVTIPGAAFGHSGEGFLRLSYGYANQADLAEAVARLRRFFGD